MAKEKVKAPTSVLSDILLLLLKQMERNICLTSSVIAGVANITTSTPFICWNILPNSIK